MTTLREAAQQALEAMRCAVPTGTITLTDWYKSITALKAALAEPVQEPQCNQHKEIRGGSIYSRLRLWRCAACTEKAKNR